MKNIHVLPTDKPRTYKGGKVSIFTAVSSMMPTESVYNIYITSDEEIKEGDWFLTDDKRVEKCAPDWRAREWHKKIILTTDFRLAPDVQKIDDEFLEWFVKNPSCEKVDLDTFSMGDKILYNVVFPKEEPKQETTLEETAERLYPTDYGVKSKDIINIIKQEAFINGAKSQMERSYSEEEVIDSIKYTIDNFFNGKIAGLNSKEIFEQFKKK